MAAKREEKRRSAGRSIRKRRESSGAPPAEWASRVFRELRALYPEAHCELTYRNAYELLVATILSAQCTDVRVNQVTPALFQAYPTPAAMAAARREDVEARVRSTGFYRNKAKALVLACTELQRRHGGEVPRTLEALTSLHGVARKTANVVLGNAFGLNEGVVVDTHVVRLSQRMGLTRHSDPGKIEPDLMALYPREDWTLLSHLLIWHGRRTCRARKPACAQCALREGCPKRGVPTERG